MEKSATVTIPSARLSNNSKNILGQNWAEPVLNFENL